MIRTCFLLAERGLYFNVGQGQGHSFFFCISEESIVFYFMNKFQKNRCLFQTQDSCQILLSDYLSLYFDADTKYVGSPKFALVYFIPYYTFTLYLDKLSDRKAEKYFQVYELILHFYCLLTTNATFHV